METRSLKLYKEALQNGKEKFYNIKVIVVGPPGVGKTTLIKRLLGDLSGIEGTSTEGMDVHTDFCKVSFTTKEWTTQVKDAEQYFKLQSVQKVLEEHIQEQEAKRKQEVWSMMGKSTTAQEDIEQEDKPISSQPVDLSFVSLNVDDMFDVEGVETSDVVVPVSEAVSDTSEKKMDTFMELYQLVIKNAEKLEKSTEEYVPLSVLDFVGKDAFYNAHQILLTKRAVYLLVLDFNQIVTDLLKGSQNYLDIEGVEMSKIHKMIGMWINSIHSCTPSPLSGIPPVILVGTHADLLTQESQQKVIDKYFLKLRYSLKDKPTIRHLLDQFSLDNTKLDPKLDRLKKRIFELASLQPHWGEEKPARWLPLEQAIMSLKASGVKVVPLSYVEELNRSGSVRIESSDELDQFLKFQHDLGTIFYFSTEEMRKKIVLDPQLLIDAVKSLTASEMFIFRTNPEIKNKWHEFRDKGILTHEVIDAVWAKDKYPEFHDNAAHILLLLERLNLIVTPRVYKEDTMETKVEEYFLVPSMLREAAPEEVFYPMPSANKESSSVLSYVFSDLYMPSTIFHHLLAACVANWTIVMMETESLIYYDCCVFDLGKHHRLTLFFRDYIIFARVTRVGTRAKTPSYRLCNEVRGFITTNLGKVLEYLRENLKFELYIQCLKSEPDSVDCVLSVNTLKKYMDLPCHLHERSHLVKCYMVLKFWFPKEELKKREGESTEEEDTDDEDVSSDHQQQEDSEEDVSSDQGEQEDSEEENVSSDKAQQEDSEEDVSSDKAQQEDSEEEDVSSDKAQLEDSEKDVSSDKAQQEDSEEENVSSDKAQDDFEANTVSSKHDQEEDFEGNVPLEEGKVEDSEEVAVSLKHRQEEESEEDAVSSKYQQEEDSLADATSSGHGPL